MLKLILYILKFQIKSKKKVLGVLLISNIETYNKYIWAANEKQKKCLKFSKGAIGNSNLKRLWENSKTS